MDDRDRLLERIDLLSAAGRHQDALIAIRHLLGTDPDDIEALLRLCPAVGVEQAGLSEATSTARRVIELAPDDPRGYWQLGRARFLADDGLEAARATEQAIRLDPDDADYHGLLARIRYYDDDHQRAMVSARAAVELEPNEPDHHCLLAVILEHLDRRDEGLDHVKIALELDPDHAEAQRLIALDRGRMWDVRHVSRALAGAAAADPTDDLTTTMGAVAFRFTLLLFLAAVAIGALVPVALWLVGPGIPAAIPVTVLAALIPIGAWVTAALLGRAQMLAGWRQIQHGASSRALGFGALVMSACWIAGVWIPSAQSRLLTVLAGFTVATVCTLWFIWPRSFTPDSFDPSTDDAVQHLDRHATWGLDRAALRLAEPLVIERPNDPDAWAAAGYVWLDAGDPQAALKAAQEGLALDDDHVDSWLLRAHAEIALDDPQAALACADRAGDLDPTSAQAPLVATIAALRVGDADLALECADQSVAFAPTSGEAHFVRGLVLEVVGRPQEAAAEHREARACNTHLAEVRPAMHRIRNGRSPSAADLVNPRLGFARVFSYLQGEALLLLAPILTVLAVVTLAGRHHDGLWWPGAFVGVLALAAVAWWWASTVAWFGADVMPAVLTELPRHLLTAALAGTTSACLLALEVAAFAPDPSLRWWALAVAWFALLLAVLARAMRR